MLSLSLSPTQIGMALAVATALAIASSASAERLVSATIGLNYTGEGRCTVVNAGADAATVNIFIIDAATGNALNTANGLVIPAGASLTLPYQALTANRQDIYCEVEKITEGAEIRMVFKRVFFNGDVTDVSDGLPTGTADNNGNTNAPGSPGPKTIFVTSSGTHTGDLGGLAGADAICQALADSPTATVPEGEYIALLSDETTTAASRLTPSAGPYINPVGLPIADGLRDLFRPRSLFPETEDHGAAVLLDESASSATDFVWTGTRTSGAIQTGATCNSWTSDSAADSAAYGDATEVSRKWIKTNTQSCDMPTALYCVQR